MNAKGKKIIPKHTSFVALDSDGSAATVSVKLRGCVLSNFFELARS